MIRIIFFILLPVIFGITVSNAQEVIAYKTLYVDSIEARVLRNSEKIFSIAGYRSPINIEDFPVDISVPGKGIFLSKNSLKKVVEKNDSIESEFIIQFLIAHELAHQGQFSLYKENIIGTSSCELKRLYECQADVIAGVYIAELYHLSDTTTHKLKTVFISKAMEYVYDLGDEEYAVTSSHPSFNERRNAFRLGVAYSMLNGNFDEKNKKIIKSAIAYRDNETVFAWSLRIAKYIIHYPKSAGVNILCWQRGDSVEKYMIWDTSKMHPIVKFVSNNFKNENSFPIRLFVQCKLISKKRNEEPEDPRVAVLQGETKNFSVVLNPGDSICFRDSLSWRGVSTNELMPSFNSPPDEGTIFNAENIQENDETASLDKGCPTGNFELETLKKQKVEKSIDLSLMNDLTKADRYAIDNFDELKIGFGDASEDLDLIEYKTNLGSDLGFNTGISRTRSIDSSFELSMILYDGNDTVEGIKMFRRISSIVKELQTNGDFKISEPKAFFYDEDDSVEISKYGFHRVIDDNIMTNLSKNNLTWSKGGKFLSTGNELLLWYWYRYFNHRQTVQVSLTISRKKEE